MQGFSFPVFKTKIPGDTQTFLLEDPVERRKYFDHKAGAEIEKLREYLHTGTFVGFLLGKKNSGKGTYSKLFMEAVGKEHIAHISVGDIVRSVHRDLGDGQKKKELFAFLSRRYRGFIPVEQIIDIIEGRDTQTLLPTEVVLALVEREIDKLGRKAVFIDGFPRELDQISYSLYFRSLMGYRDDPDFFAFIDVPNTVMDARMKTRVVCPKCQTPRTTKLLRTKEIGYDEATKEFYLMCDNAGCAGTRMVSKEGDALGIEAIRNRIEADDAVMRTLLKLQGVPKILLRNCVSVSEAQEAIDAYEITPGYSYAWDPAEKKVRVIEEPWIVNDDDNVPSYSLLPAAVIVSFIRQLTIVLGL
ncbi:MAG: nucleoside monophosphate kinase [Candidatus Sungbacteria bacterium]|nr:nucleoside monophosphate kinase [Candidatus Sungbacteria bacterium]